MKNERYVITDGTWFLTGSSNFTREAMLALKFADRPAVDARLKVVAHVVGNSFRVRRLNLMTGGVR